MMTGSRPAGAGCNSSDECESGGEYSVCYDGRSSGQSGTGVCAEIVLADDKKCGFSFDTGELRVCPDGTFCDISGLEPDPQAAPNKNNFVFSAKCRGYLGAGDSCRDPDTNSILAVRRRPLL